jgi:SAM-dependent methyltransferase
MRNRRDFRQQHSWDSHYVQKTTFYALFASAAIHWPFLLEVYRNTKTAVLEIGCGRGVHSIFLSYLVPIVVGVDNNVKLVGKAREDNSRFRGRARFLLRDAFKLDFPDGAFDVCFSQGFMEHFTNEEIRQLIEEQLRIAKIIVASVPSVFYSTKDRGDERLMSIEEWREVLKNFSTNMFYYGYRPSQPDHDASPKNLMDIGKILRLLSSRHYKSHICIIIKKVHNCDVFSNLCT